MSAFSGHVTGKAYVKPQGAKYDQAFSLGCAARKNKRFAEAARWFERAWQCMQNAFAAAFNCGLAYRELREWPNAAHWFARAAACENANAHALWLLGEALAEQGAYSDAIRALRQAIACDPSCVDAWHVLGGALRDTNNVKEAIACYKRALSGAPEFTEAKGNLAELLVSIGQVEEAQKLNAEILRRLPLCARAYSNLLLAMHYNQWASCEDLFCAHRRWATLHEKDTPAGKKTRREKKKPLRAGFCSPDFRKHSVAYFLRSFIAHCDPERLVTYAYANVASPDAMTSCLQSAFDSWRTIYRCSDQHAAAIIKKDGIDILIDCAGHTAGNRLTLMALRPAPLQVTWLGYPNTTGLSCIDFRITDRWADPEGADALHSEKLYRMRDGFLCYRPPDNAPAPNAGDEDRNGVLFGSCNNPAKITPQTIQLWARILQSVKGARLMLKNRVFEDTYVQKLFQKGFAQEGIAAERLLFRGRIPDMSQHLSVYNTIDIALDTFPYNGTTTTCEALWMGAPVITLAGKRHASRVGLSLLSQLGLREFVAESQDSYAGLAIALAEDQCRRKKLRRELRGIMAKAPLWP